MSTEVTPVKSSKGGSGMKPGTLKWSPVDIDILLCVSEKNFLEGKDMWEEVALDDHSHKAKCTRTGESCKNKFEKLDFQS